MFLLRNVTFFKLWLGTLFANLGSIFYEVVVVWYLVTNGSSALVIAGIPITFMVGYNAGAWKIRKIVDMISTKMIMCFCLLIKVAFLIVMIYGHVLFFHQPLLLYIFSIIFGGVTSVFEIVRSKSIAELVAEEDIMKANGIEGVSAGIVRIFAWGLGGFFVMNFDILASLFLALLVGFVSLLLIYTTKWTYKLSYDEKTVGRAEQNSVDFLPLIISNIINLEVMFNFLMGFLWAAFPFKVAAIGNGLLYGFQGAAFGVGYLATSLLVAKFSKNKKMKTFYVLGLSIYMLQNLMFTLTQNPFVFLMSLLIGGVATTYWITGRSTIIHTKLNTEIVGSIFARLKFKTGMAQLPGYLIGGLLVDMFGFYIVMYVIISLQIFVLHDLLFKISNN